MAKNRDHEPEAVAGSREHEGDRIGMAVFHDAFERFVAPEVRQRIEEGSRRPDEPVRAFQVLFPAGGSIVRLEGEIGGTALAVAARPLAKHQEVFQTDITGITEYRLAEADADTPHVTAFAHRDGWSLIFEFAGGDASRHAVYERANEFRETARSTLEAKRLGAFLDTAFSATELLAKAELLSCRPTVDVMLSSKSHGRVQATYNMWGKLDNTERKFVELLNKLARLRPAGRYVEGEVPISAADAAEIMADLDAMAKHVADVVEEKPAASAFSPTRFNVWATRSITAGQPITAADYSIVPPRGS